VRRKEAEVCVRENSGRIKSKGPEPDSGRDSTPPPPSVHPLKGTLYGISAYRLSACGGACTEVRRTDSAQHNDINNLAFCYDKFGISLRISLEDGADVNAYRDPIRINLIMEYFLLLRMTCVMFV